MQIITHHKHAVNLTKAERIASAVGGGVLAAAGLTTGGRRGIALALVGGDLIRRAITGHSYLYELLGVRTSPRTNENLPYELGIRADKSITIDRPRAELYRFWRELSNLPRFMKHVESVRKLDDERSHWVVKASAGRMVEWDAVIHNEVENEIIAWKSLPGADVENAGSVLFRDAPGGRGTEVRVELQYNPPAGALGAVIASLWGAEPERLIHEDLRRLKQLMEAGEVPTTEGQPAGREAVREPLGASDLDWPVEEASEESFPASDAPAYNH
jgi:uncharacterized membrane protein